MNCYYDIQKKSIPIILILIYSIFAIFEKEDLNEYLKKMSIYTWEIHILNHK